MAVNVKDIFEGWSENLPDQEKIHKAELILKIADSLTPTPKQQKIIDEAESFLLQYE